MVVEAAGGSGLLVGAPYAGLGLANFGKVSTTPCVEQHTTQIVVVVRSISLTQAQSCQAVTSVRSVREHRRLAQGGESNLLSSSDFVWLKLCECQNPYILMKRWASAELTLHEEGSMFGSSIASSKSSRGEASDSQR